MTIAVVRWTRTDKLIRMAAGSQLTSPPSHQVTSKCAGRDQSHGIPRK